jgi:hypothetical protein
MNSLSCTVKPTKKLLNAVTAQCLAALALMAVSSTATAAEVSGWRTIREMGCHRLDGTCFVVPGGAAVTGGPGCVSNLVRWDSKGDASGKNWLALFMQAKATGKRVSLYVEGCYTAQPQDPTFGYGMLEP